MAEDIRNNIPKEILLRGIISKNIKDLRKNRNITQEDLARLTGISRSSIARWETCQQSTSVEHLLIIAKALDASINDLFYGWEEVF